MSNPIFPEGIRAFAPHKNAPDFVLSSVVVSPNQLVEWLKKNNELLKNYKGEKQLKLQLLNSKGGKPYFSVDTYEANNKKIEDVKDITSDDLPF